MRSDFPVGTQRAGIDLIRELERKRLTPNEIDDLLVQYPTDTRLISHLLQKPEFPQHRVLSILGKMYSIELMRVAQAPRAAPFVRQRAELTLQERFRQMQKGEQVSIMKQMGAQLLKRFVTATDLQVLEAIINNPRCTEGVVLEMIRKKKTHYVYQAIMGSRWVTNQTVAELIALDPSAPIRLQLALIPIMPISIIRKCLRTSSLHQAVKAAMEKRIKS